MLRLTARLSCLAILAWLNLTVSQLSAQVNIWTYHFDNARTGANTNETILTLSNVNTNSFGKLFSYPVDGYIFAEPLYIPHVNVTNQGVHNVVFVATEGDTVYAFDADSNSGSNSGVLWSRNLLGTGETTLTTGDVGTTDITPQIGITGTPVIDTNIGTLYVVAKSKLVGVGGTTNFYQRLHALDITSGNERPNSPVVIQASVSGKGDGSSASKLAFDALREGQRSALLLLSNVVYISWASHGDNRPYHGWVMGYDKTSLAQVSLYNTSPNGTNTGIWEGGNGPAADANGNFFVMTGNGWYDGPTNGDYGDSFLRLTVTNAVTNLAIGDWFTPYCQMGLGGTLANDSDIGSGGPLLLPDAVGSATHPHLIVGAGKGNNNFGGVTIYLIDRDNMGRYNAGGTSDTNIVQEVVGQLPVPQMSTPTYWNYKLYYCAFQDYVHAFSISNAVLSATPVDSSSTKASGWFGTTMTISANGKSNGIVWVIDPYKGTVSNAVVHAYNASSLTTELWNSAMAVGGRDTAPGGVKFTTPTVVNGKVYVGGQAALAVYGNAAFGVAPYFASQPQNQTVVAGNNATFNVAVNSGTNSYNLQWYFDGAIIPGATGTSYMVANAQTNNVGSYYVVVSNSLGSTASSLAYLSVVSNTPGAALAPANLVDWWPADGNPVDLVTGNAATLVNNVTYTNGESGLAFHFDGVNSYINVGMPNLLPPWTLCLWAYRESSTSNSSILFSDASKYYLKLEQYNNTHDVGVSQLSYLDSIFGAGYMTPSNGWAHLAFVASSTNISLYANGGFVGSITTNNIPMPLRYMGTGSTGSRFIDYVHGALDDIQVYNRMLDASEINTIYNAGSASLVAAPQFTQFSETNGALTLSFEGLTGKTFTIYSSTNLMTWTPVTTLPNPTGLNSYTVTVSTNTMEKFFRVSQP